MDLRPRPESPAPVIERSRHLPRRTKLAFSAGSLEEAVVGAAGITRFLLFMILIRTTKTFYTVRHAALGPELTEDYHERTSIFGYNAVTGMVGGAGSVCSCWWWCFQAAEYSNGLLNEGRYALLAPFGAVTIYSRAYSLRVERARAEGAVELRQRLHRRQPRTRRSAATAPTPNAPGSGGCCLRRGGSAVLAVLVTDGARLLQCREGIADGLLRRLVPLHVQLRDDVGTADTFAAGCLNHRDDRGAP